MIFHTDRLNRNDFLSNISFPWWKVGICGSNCIFVGPKARGVEILCPSLSSEVLLSEALEFGFVVSEVSIFICI
jgi:hypothetical protein